MNGSTYKTSSFQNHGCKEEGKEDRKEVRKEARVSRSRAKTPQNAGFLLYMV
jgi:hypothetical protein